MRTERLKRLRFCTILSAALAMIAILVLAGCSSEDEPTGPTSAPPTVYFWETRVPLGFDDFQAVGVATKDTLFLAITNDLNYDSTNAIKTTLVSYDGGEEWQYGQRLKDTVYHALRRFDQAFYAVSDQSIFKSTDGKTWFPATWSGTGDSTRCGCVLFDVVKGGNGYVAVARRYLAFSPDGNTWGLISRVLITDDNVWFTRAAFDGSRYVVLAQNFTKGRTEFYESADGTNWSLLSDLPLPSMNDIVWSDSGFVAVSDTGGLYVSRDAINWTAVDIGTLADLRFVEWGNGQYIAGGTYGTLLVSNNGSTWKAQSHNDQHTLLAAYWTGRRYVVVGENVILVTYLPPD